jgi:hypothetical protein
MYDWQEAECSVEGCAKPRKYKETGWCTTHYERWRRHGDHLRGEGARLPRSATAEQRFWTKVEKTSGCWLWKASTTSEGYGQFSFNGKLVKAHRFCYELLVSKVPSELMLDHKVTCPRRCVRPDHLRLVTHKQNCQNRRRETKSSSGVRGVTRASNSGKWQANVRHNYKLYSLGRFDTIEEAEVAVKAKRLELFTHSDIDHDIPIDRPTNN